MQLNEQLNRYIDEHIDELFEIVGRLCKHPSVSTDSCGENAPYGQACRDVLDEALAICAEYGFKTHDDAGYAGHGEIAEGEELIGIMAHLDVVPAGEGWASEPYSLDIRDGKAYGRGTIDNKGPAAAAIFAMHALLECGVPLKRRVRVIMGCNEENGMDDLVHYFAGNEMPLWGFTPDANYPVINCEKHIFQAVFEKQVEDMGKVKSIACGERFNVVPEKAEIILTEVLTEDEKAAAAAYAAENEIKIDVADDKITVLGMAAHASHPNLGVNAAGHALRLIDACALCAGDGKEAVAYLAKHVGLETDGASLGMACEDEQSGALTCNLGVINVENGKFFVGFDMRCPVQVAPQLLKDNMKAAAERGGFEMIIRHFEDGIYVDEKAELIGVLLETYEAQTGRKGETIAIGGGTYARQMPNRAVAFGPCFPEKVDMCHQRDEYIEVEDLIILCKICAQALARLAG